MKIVHRTCHSNQSHPFGVSDVCINLRFWRQPFRRNICFFVLLSFYGNEIFASEILISSAQNEVDNYSFSKMKREISVTHFQSKQYKIIGMEEPNKNKTKIKLNNNGARIVFFFSIEFLLNNNLLCVRLLFANSEFKIRHHGQSDNIRVELQEINGSVSPSVPTHTITLNRCKKKNLRSFALMYLAIL